MSDWILIAGIGQFGILIASAQVPFRLDWKSIFQNLPRLHRQMYWVYGGYIVLSTLAFGTISVLHADELASGSGLARAFCAYVAVFWGIRVCLQPVLDVKEFLTTWWLTLGYHTLTILFLFFVAVYGYAAIAT